MLVTGASSLRSIVQLPATASRAPGSVATRSASPTLDPAPARTELAPIGRMEQSQEGRSECAAVSARV